MCHDYENWFWRTREVERKQPQATPKEEIRTPEPAPAPPTREPTPQVREREKVPA